MYESYWELRHKPFEPTSDQRDYFPSEAHQGALLKLRYAIENRRGAALLFGSSGTGKTMLVEAVARQLAEDFSPLVHLVFPQMSGGELLAYLADELGAPDRGYEPLTLDQTVRRLEHALLANTRDGRHAVVAVDEAQLLANTPALDTLRLLLNFELAGRPALTLLLIGEPSILPAIARSPQWQQRISVKAVLRAFSEQETAAYVAHRLQAAGATRDIFQPEALQTLHALSGGVARQINRLADLALLVGFAEKWPQVSADQLASVNEEMLTLTPD